MKNIRKISFLFALTGLLFFAGSACADISTSGSVGGDRPVSYTVKCNPGDSFHASVSAEYPVSVDILFMTPAGNEWAQNSVAGSDRKTIHELSHTAPSTPPANNASHHHYKISILASTEKLTRFSLNIKQYPANKGKKDPAFDKAAALKLEKLAIALDGKKKQIGNELRSIIKQIKEADSELAARKPKMDSLRAELEAMKNRIRSETDKSAKASLTASFEQKRTSANAYIGEYNRLVHERNALYQSTIPYKDPWEEIEALEKDIIAAMKRDDMKECVRIANGSPLAQSLGWQIME